MGLNLRTKRSPPLTEVHTIRDRMCELVRVLGLDAPQNVSSRLGTG